MTSETYAVKQTHTIVCGKADALWKHTTECPNAPESKRQWAKDNLWSCEVTTAANKTHLQLSFPPSAPSPILSPSLLQVLASGTPVTPVLSPILNTLLLQFQPTLPTTHPGAG